MWRRVSAFTAAFQHHSEKATNSATDASRCFDRHPSGRGVSTACRTRAATSGLCPLSRAVALASGSVPLARSHFPVRYPLCPTTASVPAPTASARRLTLHVGKHACLHSRGGPLPCPSLPWSAPCPSRRAVSSPRYDLRNPRRHTLASRTAGQTASWLHADRGNSTSRQSDAVTVITAVTAAARVERARTRNDADI